MGPGPRLQAPRATFWRCWTNLQKKTDIRRDVFAGKIERRRVVDSAGGGIRDTAKAAGRLLIGRVLSFRERTGIRSGDPYFTMLPRSSGPSTHILRSDLKMSEIRLRPVLPVATPNAQIQHEWHLLCYSWHSRLRLATVIAQYR